METIDELQELVESLGQENARGRLLKRGEARATIRREGILPEDAPPLGATLDTDLSEFGFSLLRACLALREQGAGPESWRKGFFKAGSAFEALVRNAASDVPERGFWRVVGASSYHLAGYSAMAYSLLKQQQGDANFAPAEMAIIRLVLRDLEALRAEARNWLRNPAHQDRAISESLTEGESNPDDAISLILTTAIYRAFALFEFALASGEEGLHGEALNVLRVALNVATRVAIVPLWWLIRIALHLIDDLWDNSLHRVLPTLGPDDSENYSEIRELFLASLYARRSSEVELWPSQREAARRAADLADDLVVALPTSAGKTRIAEICSLMTLSTGKRILIVTPLRALSAQTERLFRNTFGPLGFSVSSLYGASGMAPGDDDALRERNIVISTPEKLDFALRNDASLIDNIGLIVLDEGHMIGAGDRELRYEVLVQRLLRREDAGQRRIVCLSAILPEGEQLEDLTAWIRSDAKGDAVQSQWRPTRQRFGTLIWRGDHARLQFDLDQDGPFIERYIEQRPAIKPRHNPFPWTRSTNRELTLAAAWKFAEEGKRTLIFCTQRDNVESYGRTIVDLWRRGFLPSLLQDENAVSRAKAIGAEWLGTDHPAVQCLDAGVAIHHGRLPNAFRRELERLLSEDVLAVTVASPTLAQGLNLNAAVLLVPRLDRAGTKLSGEEFANIAGRAGRAFVDLEGLVIHVLHGSEQQQRLRKWRGLVTAAKARSLESGLVLVADEVLRRLARGGILNREDAFEYLANNNDAWGDPEQEENKEPFEHLLEKLDSIVLGLVEALDADTEDLPQLIDQMLTGSLWARQITRRGEDERQKQLALFNARSRLIWNYTTPVQRRGHFAMGVGLDAGLMIDEMAEELAALVDKADEASLSGDLEDMTDALSSIAERLLVVRPFAPNAPLPSNLRVLLASWLDGTPVREIGPDNMQVIENLFIYRLVWAIEAIRTRRVALGWQPEIVVGGGAACVETGVPRLMMAMLIRAGLPSREAAKAVIDDLKPEFIDNAGLIRWLRSNDVAALTDTLNWPTAETASLWHHFRGEMLGGASQRWTSRKMRRNIELDTQVRQPVANRPYRVEALEDGSVGIYTPDFQPVVMLRGGMRDQLPSVLSARFEEGSRQAIVKRLGRGGRTWRSER